MFDPELSSYHEPKVRELLRCAVGVGAPVAITRQKSGICIGFGQKYIPRGGLDHRHAGTYIDFSTAIVRPSDGGPDVAVALSRVQVNDIHIRIGDLPRTEYWEGDRVRISDVSTRADPTGWVVERIDYGMSVPVYTLRSFERTGPPHNNHLTNKVTAERLALLERGNIWKLAHGEELFFPDYPSKAKFLQSIGMSYKVHRMFTERELRDSPPSAPRSTDEWEFKDAIAELRSGRGDEIKLKDKRALTYVVIKYEDRGFGESLRAHTMARFGLLDEVSA